MPDMVVDASVIAERVFADSRADEAALIIRSNNLCAPDLLGYELANVLRTKVRRQPDQLDLFITALEKALALPIRLGRVDHVAAARLAVETGLSAYDASYLLMARDLGAQLATFDKRLEQAARGAG
ncbi:MAG: type II toxin-antitoxin system VapC family toxin [Chloroflexi bacterium]|nr:type II toxin-antitoxin system VapC family toxin [Chloroflexota bacterium]